MGWVFLFCIQMLRSFSFKDFVVVLLMFVGAAYGWKFYLMHHSPTAAIATNGLPTQGHVVGVADGVTLTLLDPAKHVEHVRIADIDAPAVASGPDKPGQPFGIEESAFLTQWATNQDVVMRCYERDRARRVVCDVWTNEGHESAARELARRGLVWARRSHKDVISDYNIPWLVDQAKLMHVGLWASKPRAVAPWRWRQQCWQEHRCGDDTLVLAASSLGK